MTEPILKNLQPGTQSAGIAWQLYPYGFETQASTAVPSIVLLHGWGMTQRVWQRLIPYLQSQCNVITIDLPGFGESVVEAPLHSLDQMISDIVAVLPERALLVGWSLGGNIALEIAQRYPQRVQGVVAIACNPSFLARPDWPGMAEAVFNSFQQGIEQSARKTLNRFALLQVQGEPDQRQMLAEIKAALSQQTTGKVLQQSLAWLGDFDQRSQLAELQVPCMFILAENDQLVPFALGSYLPKSVPVAILPDCAHAPFLSATQTIATKILNFAEQEQILAHHSGNLDKQLVASSFGRAAQSYDQAARLQREVADQLLQRMPATVEGSVADLGCGTGYCVAQLAQRNYPTPIAIDIAEPMLRYARDEKRLAAIYLAGDAEAIPLADNSLDVIVSSLAVQWCEHLPRLFSEIRRVLKPNGSCYIATFGQNTLPELREAWQHVDDYSHVNRFYPMTVLERVAQQQGLLVEMQQSREFVLHYKNFLQLARELKALGAHNINRGRPRGLLGRARLQTLEAAYECYRDDEGMLPATYEVVFAHYQKAAMDQR